MVEEIKKGDERVEITITTRHNDFAEIEIERLRDDIEVSPEDMRLAKRVFKHAYKEYKKMRIKEIEVGIDVPKEKAKKEKKEEEKFGPHHKMIKNAVDKGCSVQLALLADNNSVIGWEPYTFRNGEVEDFHPERFRIDGKRVSLKERLIIQPSVISKPLTETVSPAREEFAAEEPDLDGTGEVETEARATATVIEDDGESAHTLVGVNGGEYDE